MRAASMFMIAASALLLSCQSHPASTISQDNPEPGLSGAPIAGAEPGAGLGPSASLTGGSFARPYARGVRVMGHAPRGGIQLGWIDHCAYVASGSAGVGVIDVSDPANPREVGSLHGRGADQAGENFDVREAPNGRRIIVVGGSYFVPPGNAPPAEPPAYFDIYDATDCEHPRHVAEFVWPESLHTSHISPDGMRVYGTRIAPFTGHGGIHVLDISDLAHPRYVGKLGATGPDGRSWEFAGHNLVLSPDERRLYVGVPGSRGGDLNRAFTSPDGNYSIERMGPAAGGVYIFDNSDIVEGRPDPKLRLIGTAEHAGWHDMVLADINGTPHLIAAGEGAVPCPGAWPHIVNIADVAHPRIVGEFRLDMNRAENCASGAAFDRGFSTASSHYNSVDSAARTRLGLFNMTAAGLRIADLRDPANPTEVAYFRPGGGCSGFTRYVPRTEQIWVTCMRGGFYVLELTPEVRAALRRRR